MFKEMTVAGFTLDTLTSKPVVLLKDASDESTVPIWISSLEAVTIAAELIGRELAAHTGHADLLTMLLDTAGMSVLRVSIDRFVEGVFSSSVSFLHEGKEVRVEVRPSQAIIASLKYKVPIMVAEEVLEQASLDAFADETVASRNDERRFVDYLENLNPDEMGKYPM